MIKMKKQKRKVIISKFFQSFIKQALAVVVLTFVVSVMYASKVPFLKNSSDALGRAIRYEMDLNGIKEKISEIGNFNGAEKE